MNAKKVKITLVSLLAVLWLGLSLFAWFHPAKEMSEAERRKLQQLPEISVESILSGKFMTDFEAYTQDQFPARDAFRRLKAVFSYDVLQKKDNNGIYIADLSSGTYNLPEKYCIPSFLYIVFLSSI